MQWVALSVGHFEGFFLVQWVDGWVGGWVDGWVDVRVPVVVGSEAFPRDLPWPSKAKKEVWGVLWLGEVWVGRRWGDSPNRTNGLNDNHQVRLQFNPEFQPQGAPRIYWCLARCSPCIT